MDNQKAYKVLVILIILVAIKYKFVVKPTQKEVKLDPPISTIYREVNSNQYYYKQVNHEKNLLFRVVSLTGDSDLYISYNNFPTYDLNNHNLSSYTCGQEEIAVENIRPLYLGVYCYTVHENCSFNLEFYRSTVKADETNYKFIASQATQDSTAVPAETASRLYKFLWAFVHVAFEDLFVVFDLFL